MGQTVASERLPEGLNWVPIGRWLSIQLPVAAIGGGVHGGRVSWCGGHGGPVDECGAADVDPMALLLVDSGPVAAVVAATFDRPTLTRWVDDASEVWLRQLAFVIGEDVALVRGDRLPPIRGRQYLVSAGGSPATKSREGSVWIPAGQRFEPEIRDDLASVFGLSGGEVAVVESMQRWSIVADDDWTMMSRAAVRQWSSGVKQDALYGG